MEGPQYVSYENYNDTAKNYNNIRQAIGLESIKNTLKLVADKKGVTVKDLVVLDAGCGTGNYTSHIYPLVKQYIGVEYNDGMVEQFKQKYDKVDSITLYQKSVFDTGLQEGIADVIIMNQVIHHLDAQNKGKSKDEISKQAHEYPNIEKTMQELYRLLKPQGALSINFTPIEQMFGLWYIKHLHPKEKTEEVWNKICPNKDKLRRILSNYGFKDINFTKIDEPFMDENYFFQIKGPFDKNFRDGDSFWGLISASEIEECLQKLQTIIDGGVDEFQKIIRKEFQEIGHSTTCTSFKN